MEKYIQQAINEYKEALKVDAENTDSLFFILEDIGTEQEMSESEYQEFCGKVEAAINTKYCTNCNGEGGMYIPSPYEEMDWFECSACNGSGKMAPGVEGGNEQCQ